jgi:hypothetical protein
MLTNEVKAYTETQSNLVVTNSLGLTKFVCYSRNLFDEVHKHGFGNEIIEQICLLQLEVCYNRVRHNRVSKNRK